MVSQTLTRPQEPFFVESIPAPQVITHLITLIHRTTGDEVSLTIETFSDRFVDVMREITHQKVMQKLQGYEVWEVITDSTPF